MQDPHDHLLRASEAGDWPSIQSALDNGADINTTIPAFHDYGNIDNMVGSTALDLAIHYEHWDVVDRLLEVDGINLEIENNDGTTPILRVCYRGNRDLVGKFRSLGCNLPHRDQSGKSALHISCSQGNYAVARYLLLEGGFTPNHVDNDGRTPLHVAVFTARKGHRLVELLLNHGADIHATTTDTYHRQTPLHFAIRSGSLASIRMLLNRGSPLEDRDSRGRNSLHLALERISRNYGNITTVMDELIGRGMSILDRDNQGNTPLDCCRNGRWNTPAGQFLCTTYRDQVVAQNGKTSLHFVLKNTTFRRTRVIRRRPRVVAMCTEVGTLSVEMFRDDILPLFPPTSIQTRSDRAGLGMLPLHVAAGKQGVPQQLLEMLMFDDACIVRDNTGALPIHHACQASAPLPAIQYLVDTGGEDTLRTRDSSGLLPLHSAARSGARVEVLLPIIRYLVETGGQETLRTQDNSGLLPLHSAARSGAPVEVLEILMFRDACRLPDHSGALPIHHACQVSARLPIIRYLVQTGGDATVQRRDREGRLPLHAFVEGHSNQSTQEVDYLVQKFPVSVTARTLSGDTPLTLAGSSTASLDVINYLVRHNPQAVNFASR